MAEGFEFFLPARCVSENSKWGREFIMESIFLVMISMFVKPAMSQTGMVGRQILSQSYRHT